MDEKSLLSKPTPRLHIPLIEMQSFQIYLLHAFPHIGASKYIQAFITPDQYRQIQIRLDQGSGTYSPFSDWRDSRNSWEINADQISASSSSSTRKRITSSSNSL